VGGNVAALAGRPFFIVGCERSGTTLVRLIVDGHPDLCVPPESHFIVGFATLARLGRPVTLDDILGHPEIRRWWTIDADDLRAYVDRRAPATYTELVRAFFEYHAARAGKARWGDKTPGQVRHLPALLRLFPDAQVIHVVRDGREVAASLTEHDWGPEHAVTGAFWWREKVRAGLRDGRRLPPDQYFEVRLEDLVADPEAVVDRLAGFLDVDPDPAMLDYPSRAPALVARGDVHARHLLQPPTAGLRDWRMGLSAREQRAVEAVCHPMLTRLAYAGSRPDPAAAAYGWAVRGAELARTGPATLRSRLALRTRSG
jgi:hypothetical protein